MTSTISICLSSTPVSRHVSLSRNLPTTPSSINVSLKQQQFHLPFSLTRLSFLKLRNSRARRIIASSSIDGSSFRPGKIVESDKLPSDVRKRTTDAIDSYGGRVTIGDVASKAGLKMNEAQKALQALAADTDGFLEVSDEGDILYVFPKDYRSRLVGKSVRMKIEPWVEKTKSAAEYLIRVSFGTTLIASIVIVFTAIFIAASSGSDDDSRRRRGGRSYNSNFNFFINPIDLFWYWDRDYYRKPKKRGNNEGMNFIESVFSFVFGDGDPNQGIEAERWKLIGQYIVSNGGVVTAEELAPYLDVWTEEERDDSYILPVLLRFNGQPEIDEEGNILYRFPSLQRTASSTSTGKKEYVGRWWSDWDGRLSKFFEEKKWQFSKTQPTERALVIGLGGLNLFGVVILATILKDMAVKPSGFLSLASSLFPLLQVYAGSFFAIPLVRWFFTLKKNSEISARNQARKLRAQALESPAISLRRKSIDNACSTIWPEVGRRYCIKHLSVNWKADFPGPKMWQLFWLACGAYSDFTFKKAMQQLDMEKKGGRVWLNDVGPQNRWSKHKFDPNIKCDVNKTNFVESFNATLGVDRCRPVLTLLEGIRRSCMVRMAARQELCESWARQDVCPNVIKRVQKLCQDSRLCRVYPSGQGEYEVKEGYSTLAVSLNDHTCKCNEWQLTGIPCKHGMRAILFAGLDPLKLVHEWYSVDTYKLAYKHGIKSVPDREQWPDSNMHPILPPVMKRGVGRPKKQRKRGEEEQRKGKRSATIKCGRCGEFGHNRLTCQGGLTKKQKEASAKGKAGKKSAPKDKGKQPASAPKRKRKEHENNSSLAKKIKNRIDGLE